MSSYKDNIFNLLKKFDSEREQHIHGWNDDNQKTFYQKHLDPIVPDTVIYINKVEDLLKLLERSKNEIASLINPLKPFYAGSPNERGDRTGGTSSEKENMIWIRTNYLKNNSR